MLIPIGPVRNIPVTLLRVSHDPPVVVEGHIIHFDGKAYQIALKDESLTYEEGEQLLLDFGAGVAGRRRTRVRSVSPSLIQVELLGRPRRRERREFPRIEGKIVLQFRVLEAAERPKLEAWLSHPHLSEATPDWCSAEPMMEFSATGLKFYIEEPLESGQLLQLRFQLSDLGAQWFACGGEVIRVEPEEDGDYSIAAAFIGLTHDALNALMEYTRHCQDILLGLDSFQDE